MRAGESVTLRFELLLTPCKPRDTTAHWGHRYYQVGYPDNPITNPSSNPNPNPIPIPSPNPDPTQVGYPDTALVEPASVAAHGAKVLNLHQGAHLVTVRVRVRVRVS